MKMSCERVARLSGEVRGGAAGGGRMKESEKTKLQCMRVFVTAPQNQSGAQQK